MIPRSRARGLASAALSSGVLASMFLAVPALADEPAPPASTAPAPATTDAGAPAPASSAPAATAPAATEPPAATPPEAPAPPPVAPIPPRTPSASPEAAPRSTSDAAADRPADAPDAEGDTRRAEGIRLGLSFGFQRAFSGSTDRLNEGSPTLLPLAVDLDFRTSASLLVGFNGYAALASRDACISADSCRARGYGIGAHIEHPLGKGPSFVPFIRYGVGYEVLYQGGAPLDPSGHLYRGALDLLDVKVGGDFVVSRGSNGKTARIGAFLGLVGGFLTSQSGVSHINGSSGSPRDLERSSGSAHLWFAMGIRGTLDP